MIGYVIVLGKYNWISKESKDEKNYNLKPLQDEQQKPLQMWPVSVI